MANFFRQSHYYKAAILIAALSFTSIFSKTIYHPDILKWEKIAMKQNPSVLEAQAKASTAKAAQLSGFLLPDTELGFSFSGSGNGFSAAQSIPFPTKIASHSRSLRLRALSLIETEEQTKKNVRSQLQKLLLEGIYLKESAGTLIELLILLKESMKEVEAGTVTGIIPVRTLTTLGLEEQQLIDRIERVKTDYGNKIIQIQAVLNFQVVEKEIKTTLNDVLLPERNKLALVESTTIKSSSIYKAFDLNKKSVEAERLYLATRFLPDLRFETSRESSQEWSIKDDSKFILKVSFPLTGFQEVGKAVELKNRIKSEVYKKEEIYNFLKQQIYISINNFNRNQDGVKRYQGQMLSAAEVNFKETLSAYTSGGATISELISTFESLLNIKLQIIAFQTQREIHLQEIIRLSGAQPKDLISN